MFLRNLTILALAGVSLAAILAAPRSPAVASPLVPPPAVDEPARSAQARETAVLAGGCFWGVQGVFQHVNGVLDAVSGYAGGDGDTAQYQTVSGGATGHAESVRITYDPSRITYGEILRIFFSVAHDPTELNRQGPDYGAQYRSAIFPQDAEQQRIAEAYIGEIDRAHVFGAALATRIEAGRRFFPAEAYHQDYLVRHPSQPYIVYNDLPKIAALRATFPRLYREAPVLVGEAGAQE